MVLDYHYYTHEATTDFPINYHLEKEMFKPKGVDPLEYIFLLPFTKRPSCVCGMIQAYQVNHWRLKTRIKLPLVCILSLAPCKKHLRAFFFFLRNGLRFTVIGNNWKQLYMKTVPGVGT